MRREESVSETTGDFGVVLSCLLPYPDCCNDSIHGVQCSSLNLTSSLAFVPELPMLANDRHL